MAEALSAGMTEDLEARTQHLDGLARQLRLLHPTHQLQEYVRRIQETQAVFVMRIRHSLEREERLLQVVAGRLQALSPLAVLARGYSITFSRPQGAIVTRAASLHAGDELETLLAQGRVVSAVRAVHPDTEASDGRSH